jgi:L-threonylcarbamoyladenylate synthase
MSHQTELLLVTAGAPEAEPIARGAQILREGGLVAFPTETVYGLGANALDGVAVAGIFAAKGRPNHNPLIVHVADTAAAQRLVTDWPERAELLAARFWPGPLTLVLPRQPQVPDIVTGGGPTVGIRVPSHPVARALLEAAGLPIAAPSANRSSEISPTRAAHVYSGLNGRVDLILDGGPTSGGLESTVLDLTTKYPTLLRPGLIAPADLEAVVGPIRRRVTPPVVVAPDRDATQMALPAPGMLARHYAPRAPLEVATDPARRVQELVQRGERVGWLTLLSPEVRQMALELVEEMGQRPLVIAMSRDPNVYASELYADLHALDAAGVTRIVVDRPPELEVWLAIRDRLHRAAVPEG